MELQWVFQARSLEKVRSDAAGCGRSYVYRAGAERHRRTRRCDGTNFLDLFVSSLAGARPCCGRVNRGLAVLGDTLFMATIDSHLIAIDAKNGGLLWNVAVAEAQAGYAMTLAPLVVKDKVIVGTAGGEYGIRGFIAAFDAQNRKEAWRFYTIPGPGEPGHETWPADTMHGSTVALRFGSRVPMIRTNLTYWGIGNPGPDWNGDERAGDNLYSYSSSRSTPIQES